MADDTQTDNAPAIPATTGYCAWHQGVTRGLRLIRIEDVGSGPGTGRQLYACHPCQIQHGLIPMADRS